MKTMGQRLLSMSTQAESGCWVWTGSINASGYGVVGVTIEPYKHVNRMAHRLAYEAWVAPIPEGLTIDHLCFVTACINPRHLRVLSAAKNAGNQRRWREPNCARGHPWTVENTGWQIREEGKRRRLCRTCERARRAAYKKRDADAA